MRLIEKAFDLAEQDLDLDWQEVDGKGSNPRIIECYKAVDGLGNPELLDDSDVPWCSCYVNKKIQDAGGKGTRSAMARSWLSWGKASSGQVGDVVVLRRGLSPSLGHVGFVVEKGLLYVKVLGGNQENNVTIQKFPRVAVLGYRTSKD